MKLMIMIGVTIGGTIGGWMGAAWFDHNNWFGGWSIIISGIGSFVGIWAGYKSAKYLGI